MDTTDFSAAGRELLAQIGVEPTGRRYNDKDPIYRDRKTGGIIYVGNHQAAEGPASVLARSSITRVVNCTDDMANFCEGAPELTYLRFNTAAWHHECPDNAALLRFVNRLFAFVDGALERGESVLVHCLAGAHRAGTTGCLLLMYKLGLDHAEAVSTACLPCSPPNTPSSCSASQRHPTARPAAPPHHPPILSLPPRPPRPRPRPRPQIRAAKLLRPIINPIGHLPLLLRRYEAAQPAVLQEQLARKISPPAASPAGRVGPSPVARPSGLEPKPGRAKPPSQAVRAGVQPARPNSAGAAVGGGYTGGYTGGYAGAAVGAFAGATADEAETLRRFAEPYR